MEQLHALALQIGAVPPECGDEGREECGGPDWSALLDWRFLTAVAVVLLVIIPGIAAENPRKRD